MTRRKSARPLSLRQLLLLTLLLSLVVGNLGLQIARRTHPKDGETWVVRRVVSGQTVEAYQASDDSARIQRVRLIGITSPLREQTPWGDRAREYLDKLVKDRKVVFEYDTERKDSSERLLAYIWLDDRLVNEQLIEEGYVLIDLSPPNLRYKAKLKNAQSEARLMEVGIWDSQKPLRTTPREFRR